MLIRLDDSVIALHPLAEPVPLDRLHPAELELVRSSSSAPRQVELAAGRFAARIALAALGATPQLAVLADVDGRPRIDPASDLFISLAHDGLYAVAAASRHPVGVDVMSFDRAASARKVVETRVATGRGQSLTPGSALPFDEALMLWTAWEALGKRTGGGVLSGPAHSVIKVEQASDGAFACVGDALVRWRAFDGHLLCIAGVRPS